MTNEIGQQVYRKLIYYFDYKIPIHFSMNNGDWRNGLILDLNEQKLTMVLKEMVFGEVPILLEDVNPNSITRYVKRGNDVKRN